MEIVRIVRQINISGNIPLTGMMVKLGNDVDGGDYPMGYESEN